MNSRFSTSPAPWTPLSFGFPDLQAHGPASGSSSSGRSTLFRTDEVSPTQELAKANQSLMQQLAKSNESLFSTLDENRQLKMQLAELQKHIK
ncbi:hypothetical protein NMY22_g16508 [Coprinellus aureogranulatus]|nr:hypothetical protein NMY22_g16508 [Coprinellus aureogranulatus]